MRRTELPKSRPAAAGVSSHGLLILVNCKHGTSEK